jgi:GT2 family glycosyltransferase
LDAPLISVVSLTWNSQRFIQDYLQTLFDDSANSDVAIEVIVVDNGSKDSTVSQLEQWRASHANLSVIRLPENRGTTYSRNLGLRAAKGEYVFVLDSDTRTPAGTLKGLVDTHRRLSEQTQNGGAQRKIGLVCPKLVYPNGDFQESARRQPTLWTKALRLLRSEKLRRWEESIPDVLDGRETSADYAISAAWFFRRELLEATGYLDEAIFYAPEDAEYCARVWASGHEVWYCPNVTIIHDCQRLTSKRPFTRMGLSHAAGLVYHWRKHGGSVLRKRVRRSR